MAIVTVIGDSTIDNKVWISPGLKHNFIRGKLGIKRARTETRIKRSHNPLIRTELSVVEHMMDLMPNHEVRDFTNDGFTTEDVLNGAARNKVFGDHLPKFFPNTEFFPLTEGANSIKESDYIVLSIGGNNIREFIQAAYNRGNHQAVRSYIRNHFPAVRQTLIDEYNEIVARITALNPNAKIILMTQYYPSFMQNNYNIYGFMKILGEELGYNGDEADVIHRLMVETYQDIFNGLADKGNITVADVTSTLNPFDKKNHSHQIEPSGKGGKQIAKLLKGVINNPQAIGHVHDISYLEDRKVFATRPMTDWTPRHPHTFTNKECHDLIKDLETSVRHLGVTDPLYFSGLKVVEEARELLKNIRPESTYEITSLKECLNAVSNAISHRNENTVRELETITKTTAPGKSSFWKKFLGAMSIVAGAILIGLGLAGIPFSGGFSALGLIPGIALFGAGIASIKSGQQKGMSLAMTDLSKQAKQSIANPEDASEEASANLGNSFVF